MPISNDYKISIIIPAINEADQLAKLITYLTSLPGTEHIAEIILSDGNSTDETRTIASNLGATVIVNEKSGRAIQMNNGARQATGAILYFLHADSLPPRNFIEQIQHKVRNGFVAGCYRLHFDYRHWFLQLNAWFTRFNMNAFRFGDQSLFVTSRVFESIKGFREELIIMEDQEIIYRIRKKGNFTVINDYVTTSARKYRLNGVYRMQAIFFYIYFSYLLGASQESLVRKYKRLIKN
ncbi:MAG: TIGR04283 family arsenosugar biosynthesis glycosyltransferase [Chitinophagaceae bacterium]